MDYLRRLSEGLEQCLHLGRNRTLAPGRLQSALLGLAEEVLSTYTPGVDVEELVWGLADPARCQVWSARARQPSPDPIYGWRPADAEELAGMAARRLAAGGLSGCPEERIDLALYGSLSEYPPLRVYLKLMEALGVSGLSPPPEPLLRADGSMRPGGGPPRALLLAALRRLAVAFRGTFPELRLRREPQANCGETLPRLPPLVQIWAERLKTTGADRARRTALENALGAGMAQYWLDRVKQRISLVDKLAFWKKTDDKERSRRLGKQLKFRRALALGAWDALVAESTVCGRGLVPLALKDGTILAHEAIARISTAETTSYRSSSRSHRWGDISCPVYHREEALSCLGGIAGILRETFGVEGTWSQLAQELAQATPGDIPVPHDPVRGFAVLPRQAVLARLAREVPPAHVRRDLESARELTLRHDQVSGHHRQVDSQIGVLDRINIFRSTPDKELAADLARERKGLAAELQQCRAQLLSLLRQACRGYPPLQLYLDLGSVREAVEEIRAVAQHREHVRQVWNASRQVYEDEIEYEHSCVLRGKDQALEAMRSWTRDFLRTFGEVPGARELLELWEIHSLGQPGWSWLWKDGEAPRARPPSS